MKRFTMQTPQTATHLDLGSHLCTGPDGRLFDRRVREMLARDPVGQSNSEASEAVAPLRLAGQASGHRMGRFAGRPRQSEGRRVGGRATAPDLA